MTLSMNVTENEYNWVCHAAKLSDCSVSDYVKEAINQRLRKQGVDAVLIRIKEKRR